MEISRLEKFHTTLFRYNFAHAFRFCCLMLFRIKKVVLRYQLRGYGIFSARCTRKFKSDLAGSHFAHA